MKKFKLRSMFLLVLTLVIGSVAGIALSESVAAETEGTTETYACFSDGESCRAEEEGTRPMEKNRREGSPYGEEGESLQQRVQRQDGTCLMDPEEAEQRRESRREARSQNGNGQQQRGQNRSG